MCHQQLIWLFLGESHESAQKFTIAALSAVFPNLLYIIILASYLLPQSDDSFYAQVCS